MSFQDPIATLLAYTGELVLYFLFLLMIVLRPKDATHKLARLVRRVAMLLARWIKR